MTTTEIKRGDIYFADLGANNVGCEQSGTRPVVVVQNNIGNRFSPTIIVACITSRIFKNPIPTHIHINANLYNLDTDSLILCEQLKTIDKSRLQSHVATLTHDDINRLNQALRISLDL